MAKLLLFLITCQLSMWTYGQQRKFEKVFAFLGSENGAFTVNQRNHHSYADKLLSIVKEFENNGNAKFDTIELKIITDSLLDVTKDILSLASFREEVNKHINFKEKVIDYIKSFKDLCDKTLTTMLSTNQFLNSDMYKKSLQILSDQIRELDKKENICKEANDKMQAKYHIKIY
jgi:hypothetical protein